VKQLLDLIIRALVHLAMESTSSIVVSNELSEFIFPAKWYNY